MAKMETDRAARTAALAVAAELAVEPTSLVAFESHGRLLVIGPAEQAEACAERLQPDLHCALLVTDDAEVAIPDKLPVFYCRNKDVVLSGHFGAFSVCLSGEEETIDIGQLLDKQRPQFDLILDLGAQPVIALAVPPLGYYPTCGNTDRLDEILVELPEMIGEFEKPKFFRYDPLICAHGDSGLHGCTRCLDTCPSGAIHSLGDKIEVDPYYCQGVGSCATACPSGAISYRYPRPADTINRLRRLLHTYREAGGAIPCLLFHDGGLSAWLTEHETSLPAYVIPVEIEEIASVGLEVWLTALAFGAYQVLLVQPQTLAASVARELQQQLQFGHSLLAAMEYCTAALQLISTQTLQANDWDETGISLAQPAGFAGSDDKRAILFAAIDHLYRQALQQPQISELPPGAPCGQIQVDRKACTLCMACVSVCPGSALYAGNDTPRLDFVEANCVQCGLCEQACPEDAIALQPRFVFDREVRNRRRILNEEPPFYCIACGKPFATRTVIEKMQAKLTGHRMFQNPAALRRLQMCGDCRVRDMFENN